MPKKKNDVSGLLKYLLIIPSVFSLASHFVSLVKYEANVMRQKMISLLAAGIFCVLFLSGVWMSLMALLVVYLMSLHLSIVFGLVLVMILNFLLFLIAMLLIVIIKRNMAFPETREAIKEIISKT